MTELSPAQFTRRIRAYQDNGAMQERIYQRHLRARQHDDADIALLARHYLQYYSGLYHEPAKELKPEVIPLLERYAWPGNVRELANVMEQLHILAPGPRIDPEDLPEDLRPPPPAWQDGPDAPAAAIPTLDVAERSLIARALAAARGNQTRAAEILSINRRRLRRKIGAYGLQSILHNPI